MHILPLILLAASTALASPRSNPNNVNNGGQQNNNGGTSSSSGFSCLTQTTAQQVANNLQHLFTDFSDAYANEILSSSYTDQSDSVQSLINNGTECPHPLGSLTFPTRASFESAQGSMGSIPFSVENVWWNCNTVFVRWVSNQSPQRVQGILVAETVQNPNGQAGIPYLINTMFSEFNSLAWLVNEGYYHGVSPAPCSS